MLFGEGPQIKNIAADLNKLFRQGSLLNQSGQTVDGDSTADQGTSDLLAARDPVIQEISVGMSGEQSARYTVSGTPPLSLPNSLGKPLKAWSVDLLPYQEGTGDPSPSNVRPIHGTDKLTITTAGKNLFDINNPLFTAGSQYNLNNYASKIENGKLYNGGQIGASGGSGITIPAQAGQYTLSFTVNGEYAKTEVRAVTIGNDGIWTSNTTIYADQSATGVLGDANITVTFPAGYTHMFFAAYSATKYGSWETDVQIELGSVATEYTPFSGMYSTVLTLPQTVYTGTIGSDGGESRWNEVDLSTVRWARDGATNYWYSLDVMLASDAYINPNNSVLCSTMTLSTSKPSTGDNAHCYYSGSLYLEVWNDTATTQADVQSGLAGVQFIYRLDNPVQFTITTPTIPTPTGTATTWATAEDGTVDSMEVTYVGKA